MKSTPTPAEESRAAENYAIAFWRARARPSFGSPWLRQTSASPAAGLLPLAHALVDEINAERRVHAEEAEKRIRRGTTMASITVELQTRAAILHGSTNQLPRRGSERPSDLIIVSTSGRCTACPCDRDLDRGDAVHVGAAGSRRSRRTGCKAQSFKIS